ncbi:hypothetical protein EVAR_79551_1 [Eumeta japonica]|uniref:Uncharacterized protein n=1 Tax=Eumeta variegata TaxID=151549 RepID=A0A4C1UE43_EUMVA|nr:hypothetical protein EVAR_79551_1 [Eumeta japonica]
MASPLCVYGLLQHLGVHSNLNAVHHHLKTAKPASLFLFETQISSLGRVSYSDCSAHNLKHTFVLRAGVCLYVWKDVCCRRLGNFGVKHLLILWVRVDCNVASFISASRTIHERKKRKLRPGAKLKRFEVLFRNESSKCRVASLILHGGCSGKLQSVAAFVARRPSADVGYGETSRLVSFMYTLIANISDIDSGINVLVGLDIPMAIDGPRNAIPVRCDDVFRVLHLDRKKRKNLLSFS